MTAGLAGQPIRAGQPFRPLESAATSITLSREYLDALLMWSMGMGHYTRSLELRDAMERSLHTDEEGDDDDDPDIGPSGRQW